MKGATHILFLKRGTIVLFDSRTQHRVLKVTKGTVNPLLVGLLDPAGSEVKMPEGMTELDVKFKKRKRKNRRTRNDSFEKNGH